MKFIITDKAPKTPNKEDKKIYVWLETAGDSLVLKSKAEDGHEAYEVQVNTEGKIFTNFNNRFKHIEDDYNH